MEAAVQITGKKAVKVLGAVCLATGVVALSAVVASGAAVGAIVEGFRSAKNTMQKILKEDEAIETDEIPAESTDEAVVAEAVVEGINETAAADEVLTGSANISEVIAEKSEPDGF